MACKSFAHLKKQIKQKTLIYRQSKKSFRISNQASTHNCAMFIINFIEPNMLPLGGPRQKHYSFSGKLLWFLSEQLQLITFKGFSGSQLYFIKGILQQQIDDARLGIYVTCFKPSQVLSSVVLMEDVPFLLLFLFKRISFYYFLLFMSTGSIVDSKLQNQLSHQTLSTTFRGINFRFVTIC